jgi:hypothetical protein
MDKCSISHILYLSCILNLVAEVAEEPPNHDLIWSRNPMRPGARLSSVDLSNRLMLASCNNSCSRLFASVYKSITVFLLFGICRLPGVKSLSSGVGFDI